jgi:protein-S-isoprenylcysteine O-methyltransferase Ste14
LAGIDRWMKRYRTLLSMVLGLVFLVLAQPNRTSLFLGAGLILLGESVRIWSSGYIRKNRMLTKTGPYSLSRNPLYVGSFLMGAGFVISMGIVWMMVLFVFFYICVYWFTIRWEEDNLKRKFPGEWEEYFSKVPRFYRPTGLAGYVPGEFTWSQVFKNKELWNASVVLIVYIVLWGKLLLSAKT